MVSLQPFKATDRHHDMLQQEHSDSADLGQGPQCRNCRSTNCYVEARIQVTRSVVVALTVFRGAICRMK